MPMHSYFTRQSGPRLDPGYVLSKLFYIRMLTNHNTKRKYRQASAPLKDSLDIRSRCTDEISIKLVILCCYIFPLIKKCKSM
jgi:hypothetical protein